MPAKDIYHDAVVNALKADGWRIAQDPFHLRIEERDVFPDLLVERGGVEYIVVEIKTFDENYSQVHQLVEAIGQYMLYEMTLIEHGYDMPIYLAVPEVAFREGILSEAMGRMARRHFALKMIVIDIDAEVIVEWIH